MTDTLPIGPVLDEALEEQRPYEGLEDAVYRVVRRREPEEATAYASGVLAAVLETAERERLTPEAAARRLAAAEARPGGTPRKEVITLEVTSIDGVPTSIVVAGTRGAPAAPPPATGLLHSEDVEQPSCEPIERLRGLPLDLPEDAVPAPSWMIGILLTLVAAVVLVGLFVALK